MVIVLIGPMGCGKTTVGRMLAGKLNCQFDDADDFHPPENIAKMRSGTPLTDEDRIGWLEILAERIDRRRKQDENLVLACSALKQKYRDILGINGIDVVSVYLKGSYLTLQERIASRNHRYMHKDLLSSQLETMEEPEEGFIVDIENSPTIIVEKICKNFTWADK